MSNKWPGKFVIGLTGNIATGKSVVRRMLEHLGAYGIDADALAHRAIAKAAPGYKPVVEMFGRWILAPDGQIERARLANVVFSDPQALAVLEGIVHPLVSQAVSLIVQRSSQPVVAIEAIKLLESDLARDCDSIWVSYAPTQVQMARLILNRKMSEAEASQRILSQAPQEKKVAAANVVIKNQGSFEDTWRQVAAAWQALFPVGEPAPAAARPAAQGAFIVQRGRPRDSEEIAALITQLHKNNKKLDRSDIMAAFGEKAFLLLQQDDHLVGVIGWQVENLVSRTTDLYLDPRIEPTDAIPALMKEMERASKDLQCEASLVFVPPDLARQEALWKGLGYAPRTANGLGVQAWQEAAAESQPNGSILLFKQLRHDRILRPI
ncbi:MAG: dephospho-CoA kinase [Anaerolineaceae bacterium]|nr:dephospho-CoA kinase [Anaerolineaceae bacterium]